MVLSGHKKLAKEKFRSYTYKSHLGKAWEMAQVC